MEIATVLNLNLPLIFSCGKVGLVGRLGSGGVGGGVGGGGAEVKVVRREEAFDFLCNCADIMDIEAAEAAVPADKERELATIGTTNFPQFNRTVAAALSSGASAASLKVFESEVFNCGEPGPLSMAHVWRALSAACSSGQLATLVELWHTNTGAVAEYLTEKTGDGEGFLRPEYGTSLDGDGRCSVS